MKKIHIMIVEKQEVEIEFFRDALQESGLSFFCTVARSLDQASSMLKNGLPDVVFVDVTEFKSDGLPPLKKFKSGQASPVVVYSSSHYVKAQQNLPGLNYVQLPKSISTMARVLKNLFIDNSVTQ